MRFEIHRESQRPLDQTTEVDGQVFDLATDRHELQKLVAKNAANGEPLIVALYRAGKRRRNNVEIDILIGITQLKRKLGSLRDGNRLNEVQACIR